MKEHHCHIIGLSHISNELIQVKQNSTYYDFWINFMLLKTELNSLNGERSFRYTPNASTVRLKSTETQFWIFPGPTHICLIDFQQPLNMLPVRVGIWCSGEGAAWDASITGMPGSRVASLLSLQLPTHMHFASQQVITLLVGFLTPTKET